MLKSEVSVFTDMVGEMDRKSLLGKKDGKNRPHTDLDVNASR